MHPRSESAAIKNFVTIKPQLKSVGVKLTKSTVKNLVSQEPGAAAKILLQIKRFVDDPSIRNGIQPSPERNAASSSFYLRCLLFEFFWRLKRHGSG